MTLKLSHTRTPEQNAYRSAKGRCNNEQHPDYSNYGQRGVKFLFESFEQFHSELGERPSEHHSLERKNNSGNYEPGNLRWATMKEQSNNRRTNQVLTFQGMAKTVTEWAEYLGKKPAHLYKRKARGWCDACTLTISKIARGADGNRWRKACHH